MFLKPSMAKPMRQLFIVTLCLFLPACAKLPNSPLSILKTPDVASTGSVQKSDANKSFYFEPVTGAPDKVSQQFRKALIDEARAKNLTVTNKPENAVYRVHSYLLSNMNGKSSGLNYIIDVNDALGYRAKRFSGDLILKPASKSQFWSSFTPANSKTIAQNAAQVLDSWTPQKRRKSVSKSPTKPKKLAKLNTPKPKRVKASKPTDNDRLTTSALSPSNFARITPIRNAPGDGRIALANAIRSELNKNGIKTIASSSIKAYVVGGDVKISDPVNGMQAIEIVWNVKDEQGQSIGSVHQNNKVPAGALDQRWGDTAKAAASAASSGILKLIKKSNHKNK